MMSTPELFKKTSLAEFSTSESLGRIVAGKIDIKAEPAINSQTVGYLFDDAVVDWQYEVTGSNPTRENQRWVKIPEGYVWSPHLQPVKNLPNQPETSLPETSLGQGMWVEVTIPYIDLVLDNPPARSSWSRYRDTLRYYYSQVLWVDSLRVDDDGKTWYRVKDMYGSYGDIFWADAAAFRVMKPEEISPINPGTADKLVQISLVNQTLSCYEGSREVYFCRISSGAKFNSAGESIDKWATPLGEFPIWRKLISVHMSGGTVSSGWDEPGVGWTVLFVGNGVAIHSTHWHNNFGVPMSHGCVNCKPEDAKWIFRWVEPYVEYDPGDITISGSGSTRVRVIE